MLIKQLGKPKMSDVLKNIPQPPLLPCNICGKLMSSSIHLLGDFSYNPARGGWEYILIADKYHCFHIFGILSSCNPGRWYYFWNGKHWKLQKPVRDDLPAW